MTLRYTLILFVSFFIISCGGGSSGTASVTPASNSTLYLGYYTEDPTADPNDPTPGVIYMYVPDTDSSFNGELFFSYAGCVGSFDTAAVNGARTANNLAGTWSGNIDGITSSGSFTATTSNAGNRYVGSWTRTGGSKDFSFGVKPNICSYTFAGKGGFSLYKIANGTTPITIDMTNPFKPVFSWTNSTNVKAYGLNVFDKACLINGGTISTCTMWGDVGGVSTSITYAAGNSNFTAKNFVSGNTYVVVYVSADTNGGVLDFASNEFLVP